MVGFRTAALVAVSAAAVTVPVSRSSAQQTLLPEAVLVARSDSTRWQTPPNGGIIRQIQYVGADLSRTRFGDGLRYFITGLPVEGGTELVCHPETYQTRIVMQLLGAWDVEIKASQQALNYHLQWTPDATMVYWPSQRKDVLGNVIEKGIYMADVVTDINGLPYGLANPRLAVSVPIDGIISHVSMMADGRRLVFRRLYQVNGVNIYALHVATVLSAPGDPDGPVPLPAPYQDVNVSLPSGLALAGSMASPVDDRVALQSYSSATTRRDLFTIVLPDSYAGEALVPFQVTKPTNAQVMYVGYEFTFSPGGQYLVYEANAQGGSQFYFTIYSNPANGSGKQKALFSKTYGYRLFGCY